MMKILKRLGAGLLSAAMLFTSGSGGSSVLHVTASPNTKTITESAGDDPLVRMFEDVNNAETITGNTSSDHQVVTANFASDGIPLSVAVEEGLVNPNPYAVIEGSDSNGNLKNLEQISETMNVVTKKKNGKGNYETSTSFNIGDDILIELSYTIPKGALDPGEKYYYQVPGMPDVIQIEEAVICDILNEQNQKIGTATLYPDGKMVFDIDPYWDPQDGFTGTARIEATIGESENGSGGSVFFPGTGTTITIGGDKEETGNSNLKVSKEAKNEWIREDSNGDKLVEYKVTISTETGYEGPFYLNDYLESWGNTDAFEQVVVKRINSEGNETTLSSNDYAVSGNRGQLNIELPTLLAGEKYEITYVVRVPKSVLENVGGDGSYYLKNGAQVDGKWVGTEINVQKPKIHKSGKYNAVTGNIDWTITVSAGNYGKTLKDQFSDNEYWSQFTDDDLENITVTINPGGSNISLKQLKNGYPVPGNGEYVFTFSTPAKDYADTSDDLDFKNEAWLGKEDGSSGNTSADSPNVPRPGDKDDRGVRKSGIRGHETTSTLEEGLFEQITWRTTIDLPDEGWTDFTYKDSFVKGIFPVNHGNPYNEFEDNDHFAFYGLLNEELLPTLKRIAQELGLQFTLSYLDSTDNVIGFYDSVTDTQTGSLKDKNRIHGFSILFKNPTGQVTSKNEISFEYSTLLDVKDFYDGEIGVAKNNWEVKKWGRSGTAQRPFEFEKEPESGRVKIVKKAAKDGDSLFTDDQTLVVVKPGENARIAYRLELTFENFNSFDDPIIVTDTLPNDVNYVESSLRFGFVYANNEETQESIEKNGVQLRVNATTSNNGRTVTFSIPKALLEAREEKGFIKFFILYTVEVDADVFQETLENGAYYPIRNRAEIDGQFDEQETIIKNPSVEKSGDQLKNEDGRYTNSAKYTIKVNEDELDLDPNSNRIILRDIATLKMDPDVVQNHGTITMDWSGLHVYRFVNGQREELGPDEFGVSFNDITTSNYFSQYELIFDLPDNEYLEIEYVYVVGNTDQHGTAYDSPILDNYAQLGMERSESEQVVWKDLNTAATATKSKVTINKFDSTSFNKKLPGAEFDIYRFHPEVNPETWERIATGVKTGPFGTITLGNGEEIGLDRDELYALIETKAPTGYIASDQIYYFALLNPDTNANDFYIKVIQAHHKSVIEGENIYLKDDVDIILTGEVNVPNIKGTQFVLEKVDGDNVNQTLSGAVFTVYEFDEETRSWKVITEEAVTDSNGRIVLGYKGILNLESNKLYAIKENNPPEGYKINENAFYFCFPEDEVDEETGIAKLAQEILQELFEKASDPSITLKNSKSYLKNQSDIILNGKVRVSNFKDIIKFQEVTIEKKWFDENGDEIQFNGDFSIHFKIIAKVKDPQTGISKNELVGYVVIGNRTYDSNFNVPKEPVDPKDPTKYIYYVYGWQSSATVSTNPSDGRYNLKPVDGIIEGLIIEEVDIPDGYYFTTKKIQGTEDSTTVRYTLIGENHEGEIKNIELPVTGGIGTHYFYWIGAFWLMAALGVLIVYLNKYRRIKIR